MVLLTTHAKRFFVSRMQDFFCKVIISVLKMLHKKLVNKTLKLHIKCVKHAKTVNMHEFQLKPDAK